MWPFKQAPDSRSRHHLSPSDFALLEKHGLATGSGIFTTIVGGVRDERVIVGDTGRLSPTGMECEGCNKRISWSKGESVREKHRRRDGTPFAFRLNCLFGQFRQILTMGAMARPGDAIAELLAFSRVGLVYVSVDNIVTVERLGDYDGASITVRATALRVVDLIDEPSLVLKQSVMEEIFSRGEDPLWVAEWHALVDKIVMAPPCPGNFRDLTPRIAHTLEKMGITVV